jgi:hypothetical protein
MLFGPECRSAVNGSSPARALLRLEFESSLQHGAAVESQRINIQLNEALNSRIRIEQAKGVVAERADIDIPEAFSRLRNYARSHNLRLTEVAEAAIANTLDSSAWTSPAS